MKNIKTIMYIGGCLMATNYLRAMEVKFDVSGEIQEARARNLVALGKVFMTNKEYQKAQEHFEKVIEEKIHEASVAHAHEQLGEIYNWALGVQGDFEKAREHFEKAQNQAADLQVRAWAIIYLGDMYYWGDGIQHRKKGMEYYELAASQNDELKVKAKACLRLGEAYHIGYSIHKDNYIKARKYYEEAIKLDEHFPHMKEDATNRLKELNEKYMQ